MGQAKEEAVPMDENVLAVIHNGGQWTYYSGTVDLWVMDWEAWARSFTDVGLPAPSFGLAREGVLLLDGKSVERVLRGLERSIVSEESLRQALRAKMPIVEWDEVMHLFPVVLIDFDSKRLFSVYSETLELERYVPQGWTGTFGEFYEMIPIEHRYWIDGKIDYLQAVQMASIGRR